MAGKGGGKAFTGSGGNGPININIKGNGPAPGGGHPVKGKGTQLGGKAY